MPDIDPEGAAEQALSLYDSDKNGSLSQAELASCPGMLGQIKSYDKDGDGTIASAEITEKIKRLRKYQVGMTSLQCEVRLNGRALENATVEFDPEPYLGGDVQAAFGTTDERGQAQMAIPADQLPVSQQKLRAIHYGTYKVRITHPETTLPPKYNAETELGYETLVGDPFATFSLTIP